MRLPGPYPELTLLTSRVSADSKGRLRSGDGVTMQETHKPGGAAANPRRSGFKWSVAAGLTVLVLSALFLSNARATSQVAGDGLGLTRTEAALGANDLALKALGQAVLLAEDNALGVADANTMELAVAEAVKTLEELSARIAELVEASEQDGEITRLAPAAVAAAGEVIELIRSGQIDAAGETLSGPAVESFEQLRDELSALRTTQEATLTSTRATANRLGDIVTFLVAFFLPLGAILAYRYAARRQLRAAEIQLDARLEAERDVVRAKDEFIGYISHELRTPLTSIFGFSEVLLESGLVDPRSAMDLIGLINHESAELARMVEDLLVSARVETNALVYKNEVVDVRCEVDAVLASMQHHGPAVDVLITDNECWGDPVRVRQILRNLLSNAYSHGGPSIRMTATQRDGMLELSVADDGAGVPTEMEPRLFTRYVHGGREALTLGSVGLGLSVVGSLADDMGGSTHYERTDGWTRFTARLPLAPRATGPSDPFQEEIATQAAYLRDHIHTRDRSVPMKA